MLARPIPREKTPSKNICGDHSSTMMWKLLQLIVQVAYLTFPGKKKKTFKNIDVSNIYTIGKYIICKRYKIQESLFNIGLHTETTLAQ